MQTYITDINNDDMGVTLTVALGVLSSYIAGNIPTIKDLFTDNTIKNKLDDYYRKAVGNWNVNLEKKTQQPIICSNT